MSKVKAKKYLGQHFLTELGIAERIVNGIPESAPHNILEIGPGMGVLTQFLLKKQGAAVKVVEIDKESVSYLQEHFKLDANEIISGDFLALDLSNIFTDQFTIIGNFPYNISSQILFKILDNKQLVPCMVGMFQKEVAQRVAAKPGSKTYGILSVLLQAYYSIEYLFTVKEGAFNPPPKVKSGVIRIVRNTANELDCNEKLFKQVVKVGFNQRRKTLSNSLKSILGDAKPTEEIFKKRPEQLSVAEFVQLTNLIEEWVSK